MWLTFNLEIPLMALQCVLDDSKTESGATRFA